MNLLITIVVCFFAGAGAGIGTGFAGMSAAAVIGPMLTAFLHLRPYEAIGIGLISDVLASAVSAYTYHKHGNLNVRDSLPMMLCVLATTVLGSILGSFIPAPTMGNTMQIALIAIGLRFLLKPVTVTREQLTDLPKKERLVKSMVGGCAVGSICGIVGAGGGMMMLFVLTSFLGYPMHIAVGTSVFIMAFTALTGGISHFAIGGMPDLLSLAFCVAFTLLWARIAARIANKASAKTLNQAVGVVMIVTSVVILLVQRFL